MEAELRENLLVLATRYSEAKGLKFATVGRLAAGDWRFFDRIQTGVSFTARKYDEIVRWFRANWPEGDEWPPSVPEPPAQDAAA